MTPFKRQTQSPRRLLAAVSHDDAESGWATLATYRFMRKSGAPANLHFVTWHLEHSDFYEQC